MGIFDTGSDGTAIDSEFARSVGITELEGKRATTVAGEVEVHKIEALDFEIGRKKLRASEANTLPLSSQLDGLQFILGFDAMLDAPFVLRPREHRISFEAPGVPDGSPFVLQGDIRPTVGFKVLNETSHAFIDTGSAQGITLPKTWVEANAGGLNALDEEETRRILGGEANVSKFIIAHLILGECGLEDVPAEAAESEEGSFAEQSSLWGNVGNQVLGRFESVAIDGRSRRISLRLGE